MSKSIKVDQLVYDELRQLQRPRETFSDAVWRLLQMYHLLNKIEPIIRGQHEYLRQKQEELESAHPVD